MGWLWWAAPEEKEAKDPTKSLDPTLKDFLNSQQPRPYELSPLPSPAPAPKAEPIHTKKPEEGSKASEKASKVSSDRPVPRESLFQDGRYAHLWATYTPQDTLLANTTTPLERVVSARKDQRDLVYRAALENCAFEHELQLTCLSSGYGTKAQRAKARMTLCREETAAFNRCYHLQNKFLQALGYMNKAGSSDEEEEHIQMHADKLYHRMMDYEAAVDEARRTNSPIPPLSSVFNPSKPSPRIERIQDLPSNIASKLDPETFSNMPPQERELVVQAATQEAKMAYLYTEGMKEYAEEMAKKRQERQNAVGRALGDPIAKFVIPDVKPAPKDKSKD